MGVMEYAFPMFRYIAMAGLVLFMAGFAVCHAMADKGKAAVEDQAIDWDDYGRVEQGEISLRLNLVPSKWKLGLTVENLSKRPLHIFAHTTGRDGKFYNDRLKVSVNGQDVAYKGPMYKIAMGKDWYETLEPGAVFTNTIDLQQYYPFEARKGDIVRVEFEYGPEWAVSEITL